MENNKLAKPENEAAVIQERAPTDEEKCVKILEAFAPLRDMRVRKPREFYVYKGIGYGGVYIDGLELPISHDNQNKDALWSENRDKYHVIQLTPEVERAINCHEELLEAAYKLAGLKELSVNEAATIRGLIRKARGDK